MTLSTVNTHTGNGWYWLQSTVFYSRFRPIGVTVFCLCVWGCKRRYACHAVTASLLRMCCRVLGRTVVHIREFRTCAVGVVSDLRSCGMPGNRCIDFNEANWRIVAISALTLIWMCSKTLLQLKERLPWWHAGLGPLRCGIVVGNALRFVFGLRLVLHLRFNTHVCLTAHASFHIHDGMQARLTLYHLHSQRRKNYLHDVSCELLSNMVVESVSQNRQLLHVLC